MLSELVKSSSAAPQFITLRGKPTAVVLSVEKYNKLTNPTQNLVEFMKSAPWPEEGLDIPARNSYPVNNHREQETESWAALMAAEPEAEYPAEQ